MIQVEATKRWQETFPGACIGVLEISGINSGGSAASLDPRKREIETELRARYAGFGRGDFLALPVMQAYESYYKKFNKTYHVQLQLESVVLKGKNLPNVNPLVDAYFMAELETLVLTAGHDVALLDGAIRVDVTQDSDEYTQMNGTVKKLHSGDMLMADEAGIVSTIMYGQDKRTPISKATTHAVYLAYSPAGVGEAQTREQLEKIQAYVELYSPGAVTDQLKVIVNP